MAVPREFTYMGPIIMIEDKKKNNTMFRYTTKYIASPGWWSFSSLVATHSEKAYPSSLR